MTERERYIKTERENREKRIKTEREREKRIKIALLEGSLDPGVLHRDRIRAEEAQARFWEIFHKLKEQGVIPDWICPCRTGDNFRQAGRFLSCKSCGVERDCNAFPIARPPMGIKCQNCEGYIILDDWQCPRCLECSEYEKKTRGKYLKHLRPRFPGSITQ